MGVLGCDLVGLGRFQDSSRCDEMREHVRDWFFH